MNTFLEFFPRTSCKKFNSVKIFMEVNIKTIAEDSFRKCYLAILFYLLLFVQPFMFFSTSKQNICLKCQCKNRKSKLSLKIKK